MGNGCCRVVGHPVAGSLSRCPLVRVRDGNGFLRAGYDQPDYERCGHCHIASGGAGHCALSWRVTGGYSVLVAGHRRHALPAIGRRGSQRNCL